MKKERAILIKNPKLRRIRNGLRTLLRLWLSDIQISLINEQISTDNQEKYGDIQKLLSELHLLEIRSICFCLFCGRSDKDMIFIPKMKQWLCIECNSKRVYFEDLRANFQISNEKLGEFFDKLGSDDGIGLSRRGAKCNGFTASKKILDQMGVIEETQGRFFELSEYYGGYCDCEIIFNAKSRFLEDGK
ncbi:hypothetical protein LCGC14_0870380 [marine sediment metagenome]|uniref:DUF2695 domain-containing protein n=1 Tax=marine sediment metagenome TaxID=412755 RepID=A0A0F9PQH1_9ZZZZ|nr:MAG: hypothetical protein Lokiarch_16420 [Candidatus Lokiarchaeum sp. GC14_75]